MPQFDLLIRAERVVVDAAEISASVGVRDGRIVAIGAVDDPGSATTEITLDPDEVLLPGLVDTHVHVNDPGRSDWEGFTTATRAAAAGGVTTILDMPLNSIPPTIDPDALAAKRAVAGPRAHVDVGFWGGAVPSSLGSLEALWDQGVFGFKCFLLDSGVPEFPPLDGAQLTAGLREIAEFDGLMIVHAEDAWVIEHAPPAEGREYDGFLHSRPRGAENLAIAKLIEAARDTGARTHLLHLSSSDALPMIASARRDGVALTVETCPHYLSFVAEDIPAGATQYKCCPPIREAANQDALWAGLAEGVIDCVVTDHSPCTPDLKQLDIGDFGAAWGGVASLQLGLPAVWTQARERGVPLADVVTWMSARPAAQARVVGKGAIAVGNDADFAVFAPEESFVVDVAALHHRNPISAYGGAKLTGVVRSTWLAGQKINDRGTILGEARGLLLTRGNRR